MPHSNGGGRKNSLAAFLLTVDRPLGPVIVGEVELAVTELLHEHEVAPIATVVLRSEADVGTGPTERRRHHLDSFETGREPLRGQRRRVDDCLRDSPALVIEQGNHRAVGAYPKRRSWRSRSGPQFLFLSCAS